MNEEFEFELVNYDFGDGKGFQVQSDQPILEESHQEMIDRLKKLIEDVYHMVCHFYNPHLELSKKDMNTCLDSVKDAHAEIKGCMLFADCYRPSGASSDFIQQEMYDSGHYRRGIEG